MESYGGSKSISQSNELRRGFSQFDSCLSIPANVKKVRIRVGIRVWLRYSPPVAKENTTERGYKMPANRRVLYIDRIDDDSPDGPYGLWEVVGNDGEGTRDILLSRGTFGECYEEGRRIDNESSETSL